MVPDMYLAFRPCQPFAGGVAGMPQICQVAKALTIACVGPISKPLLAALQMM